MNITMVNGKHWLILYLFVDHMLNKFILYRTESSKKMPKDIPQKADWVDEALTAYEHYAETT